MAKLANAFLDTSGSDAPQPSLWSAIDRVQGRDSTHKAANRTSGCPSMCLAPQPDASNYTIHEQIGVGCGGTRVHRCVDANSGNQFALKIVPRADYKPSPTEGLLIDQWQPVNSILPSHVVTKGTNTYISMQLASGGDLLEYILKHGTLQEMEVARIVAKLAKAVKSLHSTMGVCHRDIKPENICIMNQTDPTDVRLCDFEHSRPLLAVDHIYSKEQSTGSSRGSLDYMAPERFYGVAAGAAGDCWGIGLVAYCLLRAKLPFEPVNEPLDRRHPRLCSDAFDQLSPAAIDLLSQLFNADPHTRIGVDGILQHPWVTGHSQTASVHHKVQAAHRQAMELSRLMHQDLEHNKFDVDYHKQQDCQA